MKRKYQQTIALYKQDDCTQTPGTRVSYPRTFDLRLCLCPLSSFTLSQNSRAKRMINPRVRLNYLRLILSEIVQLYRIGSGIYPPLLPVINLCLSCATPPPLNNSRARKNAFTEKNIRPGWHHSGLALINGNKRRDFTSFHSSPTTQLDLDPAIPSSHTFEDLLRNSVKPDTEALNPPNFKLLGLAIRHEIQTSIRQEILKVLFYNRNVLTENIILKCGLREIKRIVCE